MVASRTSSIDAHLKECDPVKYQRQLQDRESGALPARAENQHQTTSGMKLLTTNCPVCRKEFELIPTKQSTLIFGIHVYDCERRKDQVKTDLRFAREIEVRQRDEVPPLVRQGSYKPPHTREQNERYEAFRRFQQMEADFGTLALNPTRSSAWSETQ
jgi:hypothetical protein